MSAFLQSGRSDTPKSGKTKVRFRPRADVTDEGIAELRASYLTNIKGDQQLLDRVVTTGSRITGTQHRESGT